LAAGVALAIVHCASTDAFDYFACPADGACPAPLVCSPDRICAPAEVCGDIVYAHGALVLDGGSAPRDTDLDGRLGCADPQCAGESCASGAGCTTGETCLADGGCGGGTFCGGPPPVCHRAEGVSCPAGTCEYPLEAAGTPCDGGYCDASGACQRLSYVPSNFQVAQVIDHVQSALNVVCDSTFDTSTLSAGGCLGSAGISPLVLPDGDAGELVVIASKDFTLVPDASITLTGARPLVFAVFGDARIDGRILAGAHLETPGPGGRDCGAPVAVSGAGAGGGGFTSPGGSGGVDGAPGVDGGSVTGPFEREPLVGGCAGGAALGDDGPRAGGGAGGALQISASGTMQIHGVLAAPGGGGLQGAPDAGGSGGGSGGALLLEADSVVLDSAAALTANGGSGGTGRTTALGSTPHDGEDGHPADLSPATTPDPGSSGGSGGAGAVRGTAALDGTSPSCVLIPCGTAGGGGGGLGRIEVRAANGCTRGPGTTLSPDVPACAGP
jgi:hypothetical protein